MGPWETRVGGPAGAGGGSGGTGGGVPGRGSVHPPLSPPPARAPPRRSPPRSPGRCRTPRPWRRRRWRRPRAPPAGPRPLLPSGASQACARHRPGPRAPRDDVTQASGPRSPGARRVSGRERGALGQRGGERTASRTSAGGLQRGSSGARHGACRRESETRPEAANRRSKRRVDADALFSAAGKNLWSGRDPAAGASGKCGPGVGADVSVPLPGSPRSPPL